MNQRLLWGGGGSLNLGLLKGSKINFGTTNFVQMCSMEKKRFPHQATMRPQNTFQTFGLRPSYPLFGLQCMRLLFMLARDFLWMWNVAWSASQLRERNESFVPPRW
jgi:hypothetical protein